MEYKTLKAKELTAGLIIEVTENGVIRRATVLEVEALPNMIIVSATLTGLAPVVHPNGDAVVQHVVIPMSPDKLLNTWKNDI